MGCGNTFKKEEIQTKDVDLTFEPIKPNFKETSDSSFFDKEKTGDIIVRRIKKANKDKVEKKEIINKKKHKSHSKKKKKEKEHIYNGPIISMLKRHVDNYKKN